MRISGASVRLQTVKHAKHAIYLICCNKLTRADVDDGSSLASNHARQNDASHPGGGLHVQRNQLRDILVRQLVEVLSERIRDADVVDQHADVDVSQEGIHLRAGLHVELTVVDRQHSDLNLGVLGLELVASVLKFVLGSGDQNHIHALLGELESHRLADSIGGTSDNR